MEIKLVKMNPLINQLGQAFLSLLEAQEYRHVRGKNMLGKEN